MVAARTDKIASGTHVEERSETDNCESPTFRILVSVKSPGILQDSARDACSKTRILAVGISLMQERKDKRGKLERSDATKKGN